MVLLKNFKIIVSKNDEKKTNWEKLKYACNCGYIIDIFKNWIKFYDLKILESQDGVFWNDENGNIFFIKFQNLWDFCIQEEDKEVIRGFEDKDNVINFKLFHYKEDSKSLEIISNVLDSFIIFCSKILKIKIEIKKY